MIKILRQNIIIVTHKNDDPYKLLEYKNLLKLIEYLSEIDDNYFNQSLFIFNWGFNDEILEELCTENYSRSILLWFAEETNIKPSNTLINKFTYIFKSYIHNNFGINNIFPLPLITPSDVYQHPIIDINERQFNLFFSGNLNRNRLSLYINLKPKATLIEQSLIKICTQIRKIGPFLYRKIYSNKTYNFSNNKKSYKIYFNNGFYTGLSPKEFSDTMANSKIVLSPKGFHSTECFRLYEAMRQGCIVISEKLPNNIIYKDIPIIQIDNWEKIYLLIEKILSNKEEIKYLSTKSIEYYNTRLSIKAIAKYIYNQSND